MAKAVKGKIKAKLKRRIRKTVGAIFLISALLVAAIPVDNLYAGEELITPIKNTITQATSSIPFVASRETIYSTSDGIFQFAYVSPGTANTNKVAVILGYNTGQLSGGALTIPDTMDAYLNYGGSGSSGGSMVAVGKSDNFLFYRELEQAVDDYGNPLYNKKTENIYDKDNNIIGTEQVDDLTNPVMVNKYYPCYAETINKWGALPLDAFYTTIDVSNPNASEDSDFEQTLAPDKQRIVGVTVAYIGNQKLIDSGNGKYSAGEWLSYDTKTEGVFAGNGNIVNLTIGQNLRGVGDYAFYNCTGLQNITLGNGLETIGNYAFANCINMSGINLETYTNLNVIGNHAFYNCQALTSFRLPASVTTLGDSVFEECRKLKTINLYSGTINSALSSIGNYAFKNCNALESLSVPSSVSETMDISTFEGCTSIQYIAVLNSSSNISEGLTAFTLEDFRVNTIPNEFYFEGVANGLLHSLANRNEFAFKALNQDIYEIVITDKDGRKATYRVNVNNELVYCEIEKGMTVVEIPSTIGPYQITSIDSTSFQYNCFIEKIIIPSSIVTIEDNAFRGCHNLEDVVFEVPINLQSIGNNAFLTQEYSTHNPGCNNTVPPLEPKLTFTAPIDYNSVPFAYAMDPSSNVNTGSQTRTYITYYSGWPSNLTVQYNPDKDKNELVDYPTLNDLTTTSLDSRPYMTNELVAARKSAIENYFSNSIMTDNERAIIDSALNINLPNGIEAIKENLFKEKEIMDNSYDISKSITTNGITDILPKSFEGMSKLQSAFIYGETNTIGDYAFLNCENLETVEITTNVSVLGIRPFAECSKLTYVSFQGGDNFVCVDAIIYKINEGAKHTIVECLESRGTLLGSSAISGNELAKVTEIYPEAFYDCDGIGSVDLKQTSIKNVPNSAFAETSKLYSVLLPHTANSISINAFKNSSLQYIEIPRYVSYIDADAFNTDRNSPNSSEVPPRGDYNRITFYCEDDSNAYIFAQNFENIETTSKEPEIFHTVYFWGYDGAILDTQTVPDGKDAVPPIAPEREGYTFVGWLPSYVEVSRNLDIVAQYNAIDPDSLKHTVTFVDYDDTILKTDLVADGMDAIPPSNPSREGYRFIGWRPAITNITTDTIIYAQYELSSTSIETHTVRFIDYNDAVLYTQKVIHGENVVGVNAPERAGYTFTGWRPAVTVVTSDVDTYAQYEKIDSSVLSYTVRFIDYNDTVLYTQRVIPGENAIEPMVPGRSGYTFTGWRPSVKNVQGNIDTYAQYEKTTDTGTGNGTASSFHTLTVRNGSGSGSYIAGHQVIIIANDPAANQAFNNWTVDPSTVTIASKTATATVLTMPASAVTVTANYTASTTSTGGTTNNNNNNSSSGTTGSGSGNSSSGTLTNNTSGSSNGTTVIVNKNGLSNTGVISATVNGSTDDFVIKISEDASASEEIVRALMNEYGDISKITYFPMDISLYDSTGTNKITDTTGLSISITLPIPDEMVTYAGNNKMAGVVDGKLDKLSVKFTTISGIPCITATVSHFSPYVIYVDTENLSAGTVTDATPQTGDGIHPKWFLSIGLACISLVLFLKKDKKKTLKYA